MRPRHRLAMIPSMELGPRVLRRGLVLALVLTTLLGDVAAAAPPPLAVSPTGSDTSACVSSSPCRTFDRAYRLASPGQLVRVAAGAYPAQSIWQDPLKTSSEDVVFLPAPGAAVTVTGTLNVYGAHLELRGLAFSAGWYVRQGAEDVTFRDTTTRSFSIGSARGVSILGGRVGPLLATGDADPKVSKSSATSSSAPTDILIDGVAFQDIGRVPGSGLHIECLQVGAADGLLIRRSTFDGCATQSILVSSWGRDYPLRDVTVEDGRFGTVPEGYHTVKISVSSAGAPCERCRVLRNVASKPIAVDVSAPGSSILVSGNSVPSADLAAPGWCDAGLSGVVWDSNTFARTPTCGTNARIGS